RDVRHLDAFPTRRSSDLSALRAVLLQFQPVEIAVAGKGELRTLTRAEWQGGLPMPAGEALLFAFYLNELLVRLLMREDPHPALLDRKSTRLNSSHVKISY